MYKILVVDDEAPIREMLKDTFQHFGHEVLMAGDGSKALTLLEQTHIDMVLSDINMPGMTGFELLGRVEREYPKIKRVLMTSYSLDDYMRMVRDHNIGNVITKSTPINFTEIKNHVNALLNNAIFGLQQYMLNTENIQHYTLVEPSQIDFISDEIASRYPDPGQQNKFKVVLIELMTNALFYGARNEAGDRKQDWDTNFILSPSEAVQVAVCTDSEKLGVSVLDQGGKLDKHTVLYWLDRQMTQGENGLPCGIFDFHGRGIFITRKYVDRFIINIEKNKRCECCIFNYFDSANVGHKPLIINEI